MRFRKYDWVADGNWENCVRSQGAYSEGDWGVIVLCTIFLVSSSINASSFHRMWLDTFWTGLVGHLSYTAGTEKSISHIFFINFGRYASFRPPWSLYKRGWIWLVTLYHFSYHMHSLDLYVDYGLENGKPEWRVIYVKKFFENVAWVHTNTDLI